MVNAETTIYIGSVRRNSVPTSSLGGKYIAPCAWGLDHCYANLESPAFLYIAQEAGLLVGYNVRVIVGLHDSNVTRITYGEFLDLLPFFAPRALHRHHVYILWILG